MSDVTEAAIWAWCNANPWWWNVVSGLGGLVALRICRLAPAHTVWGRSTRVVLLIGCGMALASHWNTGFGLISPAVVLLGVWMLVEQLIAGCLRAGHIRPMPWRQGGVEMAPSRLRALR